jgi:predicted RNA-binding protein associated with RNAse of E/G family
MCSRFRPANDRYQNNVIIGSKELCLSLQLNAKRKKICFGFHNRVSLYRRKQGYCLIYKWKVKKPCFCPCVSITSPNKFYKMNLFGQNGVSSLLIYKSDNLPVFFYTDIETPDRENQNIFLFSWHSSEVTGRVPSIQ